MSRIKMGQLSGLKPGRAYEKKILARRIAVFNHQGKLIALEGDCKHMRASLAQSGVSEGIITCDWHGWQYDVTTGECLTDKNICLKRFEVEIEGDDIYVVLPE